MWSGILFLLLKEKIVNMRYEGLKISLIKIIGCTEIVINMVFQTRIEQSFEFFLKCGENDIETGKY